MHESPSEDRTHYSEEIERPTQLLNFTPRRSARHCKDSAP